MNLSLGTAKRTVKSPLDLPKMPCCLLFGLFNFDSCVEKGMVLHRGGLWHHCRRHCLCRECRLHSSTTFQLKIHSCLAMKCSLHGIHAFGGLGWGSSDLCLG